MMARLIDLTNQRFGRLFILRRAGGKATRDANHNAMWECRCDCGARTIVAGANLRSVVTASCGCLHRERVSAARRTHGMSQSPEYSTWKGMKERCHNPNSERYSAYGGRGIHVCARWHKSFMNFFTDMGAKPSPKYSLDRIDNNKGYSPENCRWATVVEQSRNRRDGFNIEYKGEKLCISDWAIKLKISRSSIYGKIGSGLTPQQAVEHYIKGKKDTRISATIDGRTMPVVDWAKEFGVTRQAVFNLMRRMSPNEAVASIKARKARSEWLRSQCK